MKLANNLENNAILSNVDNIGEFRIKNSAKAFNILSSALYSNKIRAIVRELGCNAYDSHVAAGKASEPFEVHLPNSYEPYFYIKDFGVGLNDDQVTNIYTTYFESTKSDSNDFVGALGLGSKSPFSYTENFTVTAIKDGIKRIYTAYINEMGVPSIALMATVEVSEANGVEVRFSVNEHGDFDRFFRETASVFKHFPNKPKVIGRSYFEFDKVNNLVDIMPGIRGNPAAAYRNNYSYAIMGNVEYPIDANIIGKTNPTLQYLLSHELFIDFSIGDLDIQPSREGLSYNANTVNAIVTKLQSIEDLVIKTINDSIDKLQFEYEKIELVEKLINGNGNINQIGNLPISLVCNVIEKKASSITGEFAKAKTRLNCGFLIRPDDGQNVDLRVRHRIGNIGTSDRSVLRFEDYTSPNRHDLGPVYGLSPTDINDYYQNKFILKCVTFAKRPIFIVVDDDGLHLHSKIKQLIKDLVAQRDEVYSRPLYVFSAEDKTKKFDHAKFVNDRLLGAKVYYTSTLAKLPTVKKATTARPPKCVNALKFNKGVIDYWGIQDVEQKIVLANECCYIDTYNGSSTDSTYTSPCSFHYSNNHITEMLTAMEYTGYLVITDSKTKERVHKLNIKHFDKIIENSISKLTEEEKLMITYIRMSAFNNKLNLQEMMKCVYGLIPSHCTYKTLIESVFGKNPHSIYVRMSAYYRKVIGNTHSTDFHKNEDSYKNKITALYQQLDAKYPMLQLLDSPAYTSQNSKIVVDYITSII